MMRTIRHWAGMPALVALVATLPAAGNAQAHAHRVFTPPRPATAADTARALEVVRQLRAATSRYPTLAAAEAAGYVARREPHGLKPDAVLHVARPRTPGERPRPFDLSNP